MKSALLGLLAETAIHPGSGQDTGYVDLPVAREKATGYPVIVGSSFKGALLDAARARGMNDADREKIFGKQEDAGALLPSDGRLLLLPVRSSTSQYKWVTCPHLLERLGRDAARGGVAGLSPTLPGPDRGTYLGAGNGPLFLEERQFDRVQQGGDLPEGLVNSLKKLVRHPSTQARLAGQVVVLHDDDFAWFAQYGLPVNARNVLDPVKKTSKNLWYEETLPPDTLFYCLWSERKPTAVDGALALFSEKPYLQAGANATVGQGWFVVQTVEGEA